MNESSWTLQRTKQANKTTRELIYRWQSCFVEEQRYPGAVWSETSSVGNAVGRHWLMLGCSDLGVRHLTLVVVVVFFTVAAPDVVVVVCE